MNKLAVFLVPKRVRTRTFVPPKTSPNGNALIHPQSTIDPTRALSAITPLDAYKKRNRLLLSVANFSIFDLLSISRTTWNRTSRLVSSLVYNHTQGMMELSCRHVTHGMRFSLEAYMINSKKLLDTNIRTIAVCYCRLSED